MSVGNGPNDVEIAAGALWVANGLDGTVSKVSPGSGLVETTVSVSSGPSDLAVDEGIVWVTDRFRGRLTQLDAETGDVDRQTSTGGQPSSVATGKGRIWVASGPSRAAHRGGTLRLVSSFGLDSIDPSVAASPESIRVLLITNDGLVGYSRIEGSPRAELVPNLATSLPVPTNGGKAYTFRLRSGIRYSTGTPVRASDFRRGMKRVLTFGSYATTYSAVAGAGRCERRPDGCDLSPGITTDDASGTITFHLTRAEPDFVSKLATLFPIPPGVPMEDVGTDPVPATGPYMIDSYEPGESLTLVRNPQFNEWSPVAKPDGYPDRIVWSMGVEEKKATKLVTDGKADYVELGGPSEEVVERIQTEFPGRVHVYPRAATYFMFLNTTTAPFDDVRVRRAINYATDRGEVARLFGAPVMASITCQFLPPNSSGFVRYCPYTSGDASDGTWTAPDLHKARQLIKRSGTSRTPVTVWALKPLFEEPGRYFVSLLGELGYPARLKLMDDAGAYFTKIAETDNDRIQMAAGGWLADGFPGAATMLEVNLCRSFSRDPSVNVNFSSFCDRDVDRLFARAARLQATDPHAANALWAKVDRLLVDRAPWVGLVNPMGLDFVSEKVGNYEPNVGFSGVWLDQLWVK